MQRLPELGTAYDEDARRYVIDGATVLEFSGGVREGIVLEADVTERG